MNDLERDLKELFERRAAGADAPGLPPRAVLRRGRRRQVGTVVIGALACLVALGVAAAAIGQARHPAVIPGGNGLPARSTTIGGVPVTAPAGWTLVDDWPLAAILATTSQTCSFSATGTAIDGNGSPVDGVPSVSPIDGGSGEGSSTGQACSQENVGYPAGVPVLQLANFEIPIMKTVCGLGDQEPPVSLPDDGVAVYVADDQAQADIPAMLAACPGSADAPAGPPQVFMDVGHHTDYVAIGVAGPNASAADIAIARDYLDSLSGIEISPTAPASAQGPGYVLAAGQGGGTSWRLEAGITSFDRRDGSPTVGASMMTTDPSGEGSRTVELATDNPVNDDYVDLGGTGVVQFGTTTARVSGIDVVDASGHAQPATLFSWPAALGSLPGVGGTPGGWVWYATAAERGTVRPTMASAPTSAPTAEPGSSLEPGNLPMKERPGGGFAIYGTDLGHDWQLVHNDGRLALFLDGSAEPAGSFTFVIGSETQIDVPGGAFLISLRDNTVTRFSVTTDATDQQPSTTIDGGWQRIQDARGEDGRVWVVPLSGSGTGIERVNEDLPNFVSWPSNPLRGGSLIAGGSDGVVSWALSWRNDHCIVLETLGVDAGDSGTSQCLPPWQDLEARGGLPLVGGVYGQTRATAAILLTHRPETRVTSPDLLDGDLQCDDYDMESNFAGTTICVFPVEVGQQVTVHLDRNGVPWGLPITVQAEPGRLNLIQTDETPTP